VTMFRRTARRATELGGQSISEGDRVAMWFVSANRDEAYFADPDRFDIARDPNPHLGFGAPGAHFCLGANLARLELRVLVEEALRRLPRLALASDAPPPRRASNFISGLESLPVECR